MSLKPPIANTIVIVLGSVCYYDLVLLSTGRSLKAGRVEKLDSLKIDWFLNPPQYYKPTNPKSAQKCLRVRNRSNEVGWVLGGQPYEYRRLRLLLRLLLATATYYYLLLLATTPEGFLNACLCTTHYHLRLLTTY